MTIESSLLTNSPYLELPQGIVGWIGWIAYLGVLVYLLWRWRSYNKRWGRLQWGIFIGLILLLPVTNCLLPYDCRRQEALSPPDKPIEPLGPAAVIFSGLPWMLAAGLLGVIPAAVLGFVSGLILALFETHNPFTILTIALWGALLGAAFQQRYRTVIFRLLRHPDGGCHNAAIGLSGFLPDRESAGCSRQPCQPAGLCLYLDRACLGSSGN